MLAVEDALDGLVWAEEIGGLSALIERTNANMAAITTWVENSENFGFLVEEEIYRSPTSVCLTITASWLIGLSIEEQMATANQLVTLLDNEGVAYDIGSYRDAPPGRRIWAGATVETCDLEALFPWLEWALDQLQMHP